MNATTSSLKRVTRRISKTGVFKEASKYLALDFLNNQTRKNLKNQQRTYSKDPADLTL